MKKLLFALVMVLIMTLLFSVSAFAVETEAVTVAETAAETVPVTETVPDAYPETVAVTYPIFVYDAPTEDEIESQVVGTIDDIDKTMAGVQWWEDAKTWVLTNLSLVVGALMTFATFVIGLATKFSFIPKILNAFKLLFSNVKTWYTDNIDELKAFRKLIEGFIEKMSGMITEMKRQSDENNALRNELVEVRKEYITLQKRSMVMETAMYSATILQADQFAKLIQLSGLTRADADTLYETYRVRKQLILDSLSETKTPVVEGVSEDV